MKRFFGTIILSVAVLASAQTGLKISQLPRTNALGPNQLFVVTAGSTNMAVSNAVMPDAIQTIRRYNGRGTNLHLYDFNQTTTNLTLHLEDQATKTDTNVMKIVDDQSGLPIFTIDNQGNFLLQGGTESGNGGASLWASNATFRGTVTVLGADVVRTNTVTSAGTGIVIHQTGSGGVAVSNAAPAVTNIAAANITNAFITAMEITSATVTNLTNTHYGQMAAVNVASNLTVGGAASVGSATVTNQVSYVIATSNVHSGAVTNFALDVNLASITVNATNGFTFTNFLNLEAGEGTTEKNVTVCIVSQTNAHPQVTLPTLGAAQFGVRIFTNANSPIWTTFTNDGRYLLNLRFTGTNALAAMSKWL